jgi:hypothetical protein
MFNSTKKHVKQLERVILISGIASTIIAFGTSVVQTHRILKLIKEVHECRKH